MSDLCGVFAVIGSSQAAAELYIALTHQQHRGQDAAGIATSNSSGKLNILREKGLAVDIFTEDSIKALDGCMGIAHNRYPTAGYGDIKECQPFFTDNNGIGIAFNGNIINYPFLKAQMEKEGRTFISNSDGELLLYVFSDAYTEKGFFQAVRAVQEKLTGGYSAVGVIEGKGIFAFKDPNGIRPLLFGKRGNKSETSYAFASESIALSIEGYNQIRDLKNGEAVFIDKNLGVQSETTMAKQHKPCVFEFVYFSAVESKLEGKSIYEVRRRLGQALASKVRKHWPELEIDVVIPVPDTSRPAADSIAKSLGIPYEEGLVKNRYIGRTFIMPTQKIRENALKLKLKPIESVIRGKNVMVVDDSIVRGTTSKRIVQLLRDFGAKKVYLLSTFPPIRNPCLYGIDFTNEKELIAGSKTIAEIEREIGADKLIYMDTEDLKEAVGLESTCTACITGEYPTETGHAKEMQEQRQRDYQKIATR
ncbi:amidophosphoribosyltransferase [Candidatus Woesearchaeota archaeon]|nr:amidophosphoribosyltransferase [Candidatus Woesearchaeota archaeon]